MKICLYDPGVENNNGSPSANLGDLIIQEAVEREIKSIFNNFEILRLSTHIFPTSEQIKPIRNCSLAFVGGTNLLSSRMRRGKKWRVSIRQQIGICNPILLGVGWQSYQDKPDLYTQFLLKIVLSNKRIHSVRDNYTKKQLVSAGFNNVINTGCPTMWPIADMDQSKIPKQKSKNALVMLTDYSKEIELDKKLIEIICNEYDQVFIWPQGRGDEAYIRSIMPSLHVPISILEHSFSSFSNFLNSGIQFDYIGTRLHGGIKCLLNYKRSLIIEIDNRAKEIAKDTHLPTIGRNEFKKLKKWIKNPSETSINLNIDAIQRWKRQFTNY